VAIVYRLFDVGFEIDLPRAADLLASSAPARVRPIRGEAQAIQIANPPIAVILGSEPVDVPGAIGDAEVSAHIFDFGGVSLRLSIRATPGLAWSEFSAFGNAVDVGMDLSPYSNDTSGRCSTASRPPSPVRRSRRSPRTTSSSASNAVRGVDGTTPHEGVGAGDGPLSPSHLGRRGSHPAAAQ